MTTEDRYVFVVEWYDNMASLIRPYHLMYFIKDNTIEMFDIKNKKLFLKRSEYPSITLKDLYIGSTITIYSRQLKVVDYADAFTRKEFEVQKERTFGMIKPDCYHNIGKIIDIIEHSGFIIGNIKMARMTQQNAEEFYAEHIGKSFYAELASFICSDFVVGMELIADGAVAKWRKLIGPTNCQVARAEAPESLRALFGSDGVRNACHGSDSTTSAQRELEFFFGEKNRLKPTAFLTNCTCCIIKPHIVLEAQVGKIIDIILNEGFEISAIQMFYLDKPTAEEFYDIYKGVLPEFQAMAGHLISGPCIVLEVRQEEAVTAFREVSGPHDPEVARSTKPNSIRARFGLDKIKNAVHCTDLAEDGSLETEFFFTILQQK